MTRYIRGRGSDAPTRLPHERRIATSGAFLLVGSFLVLPPRSADADPDRGPSTAPNSEDSALRAGIDVVHGDERRAGPAHGGQRRTTAVLKRLTNAHTYEFTVAADDPAPRPASTG
jgi:hypothetical protein